jgi:ATP-dependent Clp protease, protease subunit
LIKYLSLDTIELTNTEKGDKIMRRNGVSFPEPSQWIFFLKEIGPESMDELYKSLIEKFDRLRKSEILLFVNSNGGDLDKANAFYYWIKFTKIKLVTIGYGEVSSSALIVFLAGHRRYILPETQFFFHEGTLATSDGMTKKGVKEAMDRFTPHVEVFRNIVSHECEITAEMSEELDSKSHVMCPEDIIRLGIAQRMVSFPVPGAQPLALPGGSAQIRLVK